MRVDYKMLEPETLRNLIENFIAGEGTDYGDQEYSMDDKVEQIMRQLKSNEAFVSYDEKSDSCNIIPSGSGPGA